MRILLISVLGVDQNRSAVDRYFTFHAIELISHQQNGSYFRLDIFYPSGSYEPHRKWPMYSLDITG